MDLDCFSQMGEAYRNKLLQERTLLSDKTFFLRLCLDGDLPVRLGRTPRVTGLRVLLTVQVQSGSHPRQG